MFIGERDKLVLLEYFTNLDGDPLKEADDDYVNDILDNNSSVVGIQYHTDFPSVDDPINALNKADPSARALYYGVLETTSSVLDGNDYLGATQGFDNDNVNLLSLQSAQFLINLDFSGTTVDQFNLEVNLTAVEDLTGEFKLYVAVLNNTLDAGGRTNRFVLNRLVPDAAGTSLPLIWIGNQQEQISLSWVPLTDQDITDLTVIAFVQDDATREIFQTVAQSLSKSQV